MDAWNKVLLADLPETMQSLAELIGEVGVRSLLRLYAGKRLYIPNKLKNHALKELLGEAAFTELVFLWGGCFISFPACSHALAKVRNREICRDRAQNNVTLFDLARKNRLTVTRVSSILKEAA